MHARPAPIIELRADCETDPPLTVIAGEGRFARWSSNQRVDQVDQVDVVDVFLTNA